MLKEATVYNRRVLLLSNDKLELAIATQGGSIIRLLLQGDAGRISPFGNPELVPNVPDGRKLQGRMDAEGHVGYRSTPEMMVAVGNGLAQGTLGRTPHFGVVTPATGLGLEAVDAPGVLFVRAPRAPEFATEPAQQMAREMWGGANRSAFLSGAALSSLAANALPEAGELSASAIRNSDLSAPAAAARARVLVSLGDVRGALEQSDRATKLDPSLPLAWETRSEALLHAGSVDDAYAAAQRAAALAPGDSGTLWLAARAANAARAYQTEAELLERLITLTTARGGDAGFYHLYLGQSYAKQGLARPALREFAAAAAAPGLTDEQRRELGEEMEQIRSAPGAP